MGNWVGNSKSSDHTHSDSAHGSTVSHAQSTSAALTENTLLCVVLKAAADNGHNSNDRFLGVSISLLASILPLPVCKFRSFKAGSA